MIKGHVKCNGSILRCDLDGNNLEVVAWGLLNPYCVSFSQEGRWFTVEHGMDERSRRYVVDFGVIHIAPERGAIRQQMDTGTLWRIRRISKEHGTLLPQPRQIPVYLLQGLVLLASFIGIGVLFA